MFKRSRRKIVASIMMILALLWVGTLGVIYASSYLERSRQNEQMLKTHADMYVLHQPMDELRPGKPVPDNGKPGAADSPAFRLSTFYTVAFSYEGELLEIRNGSSMIHTDEDLKKLAQNKIAKKKSFGTENNLVFYVADKGGYMLVVFMDNTIIHENEATLLRYTFLFGGVALIAFFGLSVYLARKIVQPLEESYQKQRQFISDAGHELKTPVSVVSTNAELLSREIGDNQWLFNIQYENERMGILVSKLLELARTENVLPQMERIDLSRLCNGEVLPFESIAFEKGLAINSSIKDGIFVEGNSTQLKQLVSILLDNAICHSAGGNEVRVNLTKEHRNAKLSVINTGDEIPADQREHIFERFYRVDMARNSEDGHYGLGLAIAKAIVTAHKGCIEVLCYNGCVEFVVRFPAT